MNPRHPYGEILRDGERIGLRFERRLAHGPERVWRALTESDQLRHWLPCDIVGPREAGASITARFWPAVTEKYSIDEPSLPGEILTWDPPKVFAWRWDTDTLHFELEPTDDGTLLVFTTWIGETPGIDQTAAGYHVCFDQLIDLVATDDPGRFIDQDPTGYEVAYAERLRREMPASPPRA